MKLPVAQPSRALPERQHPHTCPTPHFLQRSSKAHKWKTRPEPYLLFSQLLPWRSSHPIQHSFSKTETPKPETPNKVQLLSSDPHPKSMAERPRRGRSLGGKGQVRTPPPPLRASVSLPGVWYGPSFSWLLRPRSWW